MYWALNKTSPRTPNSLLSIRQSFGILPAQDNQNPTLNNRLAIHSPSAPCSALSYYTSSIALWGALTRRRGHSGLITVVLTLDTTHFPRRTALLWLGHLHDVDGAVIRPLGQLSQLPMYCSYRHATFYRSGTCPCPMDSEEYVYAWRPPTPIASLKIYPRSSSLQSLLYGRRRNIRACQHCYMGLSSSERLAYGPLVIQFCNIPLFCHLSSRATSEILRERSVATVLGVWTSTAKLSGALGASAPLRLVYCAARPGGTCAPSLVLSWQPNPQLKGWTCAMGLSKVCTCRSL